MSKGDSKKFVAPLICDHCGLTFGNKLELSRHLQLHTLKPETEIKPINNNFHLCKICKISFPNKSKLSFHNRNHSRQIANRSNKKLKHVCDGCHNRYLYNCQLKYHIRKCHYNLVTNAPYSEYTKVNQVWFEKVLNTDIIVEIQKIANNHLLIRKLNDNTQIKPSKMPRGVIDLRSLYPVKSVGVQCRVCDVICRKKDIHKHVMENHSALLHNRCNKCNCEFKKLTECLSHVCP